MHAHTHIYTHACIHTHMHIVCIANFGTDFLLEGYCPVSCPYSVGMCHEYG